MRGVLNLGAGGHGNVVAGILCCAGVPVLGFLDDDPATWGATRLGVPITVKGVLPADRLCRSLRCRLARRRREAGEGERCCAEAEEAGDAEGAPGVRGGFGRIE